MGLGSLELGFETCVLRFDTGGDQHHEWIARLPRANLHANAAQPGAPEQPLELSIGKAETLVSEAGTDPVLVVFAEIEDEQAAAGPQNPDGLSHRAFRVGGVVQGL